MSRWSKIRDTLWTRCGGRCEVSGIALDFDTFDSHHRRNRGMGGTVRPDKDWLSNLLAVEPNVHNSGPQSVHGRRRWSEERGYLIPKDIQWASMVPALIFGRFLFMLGDDGQYYPPPPGLGIPPVTNRFD